MKPVQLSLERRLLSLCLTVAFAAIFGLLQVAQAAPPGAATSSSTNKAARVNVNSADLETLQTLPGVGPAIAQRIIDGRPYKSYSDLEKVKGLSKSKVDAMKGQVTFGSTTAKSGKTTKSGSSKSAESSVNKTTSDNTSTKPLPPTGKSAATTGGRININTATAEELDALPGIGPTKAQAIIDYRNQNGTFKSIDDIKNVKGIKEGEFSKIQDRITVR
jgi:competence protein ComEA